MNNKKNYKKNENKRQENKRQENKRQENISNEKKNVELVNSLGRLNLHPMVEYILFENDRGKYSPIQPPDISIYDDKPYNLGMRNKQTMSAPHIHAMAFNFMYTNYLIPKLEKIYFDYSKLNFNVLDIGSGTGYVVAGMTQMIKPHLNNNKIIGLDIYKSLTNLTKTNLNKTPYFKKEIEKGNIILKCGNGWKGFQKQAPYSFIHLGCMAPHLPIELYKQLEIGGGMLIPNQGNYELITKINEKKYTKKTITGVRFVPFIKSEIIKERKKEFENTTDIVCIDDTN